MPKVVRVQGQRIQIPNGWKKVKPYEVVEKDDLFLNLLELERGQVVFSPVDEEDLRGKITGNDVTLLIRKA